jgi:hypothetical protein
LTQLAQGLLFPIAATATLAGFAWKGWGGGWRIFLPGAAAFLAAVAVRVSPAFLLLFALPTLLTGVGARRGRVPGRVFAAFAASDLFLGLAVTSFHSDTAAWSLPEAGWGAGAGFAALAAAARIGGAAAAGEQGGAVASIGWWQGLLLAWWASGSAGSLLAIAGLGAWLLTPSIETSQGRGAALGGGAALILCSLGPAHPAAVLGAGLAGSAFALGEHGIPTWALMAAPFSSAASASEAVGLDGPRLAGASVFAAALAAAAWSATRHPRPAQEDGGRLLAAGAVGASMFAVGFETVLWLAVVGAGAIFLTWRWFEPPSPWLRRPAPPPDSPPSSIPVQIAGWAILAMALVLVARLVLLGLHTGFV